MGCARARDAVLDDDREALHGLLAPIGLPHTVLPVVAMLLWQDHWREKQDPVAYLVSTVRWRQRQCRHGERAARGPSGQGPLVSLAQPVSAEEAERATLAAMIADPRRDADEAFALAESMLALETTRRQARLDSHTRQLAWRRLLEAVHRSETATRLGWTPRATARVWQALQRARARLRKRLDPRA